MQRKRSLLWVSLLLVFGCSDNGPLKNGSSATGAPDAAAGGAGGGSQAGSTTAGQSGSQSSGGTTAGSSSTQGGAGQSAGGSSLQAGTTSTGIGGSGLAGTTGTGGRSGGTGGSSTTSLTGGTSVVGGTSTVGGTSSSTIKGGTSSIGGTSAGGAVGGTPRGGTTTLVGGSTNGGSTAVGSGGSTGGQTVTTSPANDSPGQNPFTRSAGSGILITSSDGLNGIDLYLAADSKGGMFVAGATRNPQAMGLAAFDAGIESEAFASRLDAQGKMLWSVPLKTCGVPADIAAGPDDTVFVLCPYEPDFTTVSTATCTDAAVVDKLSGTDGKLLFEVQVKIPSQPADAGLCPYGLGVDSQGRSYVGGGYAPTFPVMRSFLVGITAAGRQDWALVSDGPAPDPTSDTATSYVTDVDVDSKGNVLFTGAFNTWTQWGTVKLTSQAKSGQWSMYNGFFGRVPATGTGVTAWRFGGTVFDDASTVTPTANGGFVVGGWGSGSTNIGGKSFTAPEEGAAFIANITEAGQATWVKALPTASITDDVAVGPDGKVYLVGKFANNEILYTYDPASDTLNPRKTVAGNATDNEIRTTSVAVSTTGAVWLSGNFKKTINLGTGALSTTTVATFLLKID